MKRILFSKFENKKKLLHLIKMLNNIKKMKDKMLLIRL